MYAALLAGRTDANDDAEVASGTKAWVTHQHHATSGTPGAICKDILVAQVVLVLSEHHLGSIAKKTPLPNFY